jgi:hypothetical protein
MIIEPLYIAFTKIFDKTGSNEIGLQLAISVMSPILYVGLISENVILCGNVPAVSILLQI